MAKKRNRLPKRVAGVKVPKALRRGRVGRLLASPVGLAIIVESMIRASERMLSGEPSIGLALGGAGAKSGAAPADTGDATAQNGSAVIHALRHAGRAFIDAIQHEQQGRAKNAPPTAGVRKGEEAKARDAKPDPRKAH